MGTRSLIAVKNAQGKYLTIYCHWRGQQLLKPLRRFYNDYEKAMKLINLGDLSAIDSKTGKAADYYPNGLEAWDDLKPILLDWAGLERNVQSAAAEYVYIFANDEWRKYIVEPFCHYRISLAN